VILLDQRGQTEPLMSRGSRGHRVLSYPIADPSPCLALLSPLPVRPQAVGGRPVRIRLLGRGEMLNLTAATGNQIQVMDLGFALQAHSLRELARDPSRFPAGPQPVPGEIDDAVARAMLAALSATR